MPRHGYVVGDLQGCFAALTALKTRLAFDEQQDQLWFAGDLVARGEDSLATLREVKRLCDIGAAHTVLGNHDLNLLAVWRGYNKRRPRDLTASIFEADDCDELLNWLRQQPLCLQPSADTVLTHAGIPPQWTVVDTQRYATEVEQVLRADLSTLDAFLSQMYGELPDLWHDDLTDMPRLRCITNYLTRMRLCTETGQLEFDFKDGLAGQMPTGFAPWFRWPPQHTRTHTVLFGHWAALEGAVQQPQVCPLDGGCVWGGALLAYRLSDGQIIRSSEGCAPSTQTL